jgi:CheY-like chemotaxis protein
MTKPLALVVYENLMPGSKLANRLHDLGYRVQTLPDASGLVAYAQKEMPLVVVLDLASPKNDICAVIQEMKNNPGTSHIPVIGYAGAMQTQLRKAAQEAGAALVASDEAIITQLPQLLEHALRLE